MKRRRPSKKPKFFCEFDELEYDSVENRVILQALTVVERTSDNQDVRLKAMDLAQKLSGVVQKTSVPYPERKKMMQSYNRQNLRYKEIHYTCHQIIEESAIIIRKFKDHFDRDRPVEVFPQLNTLPSKTNKTRSYPSGHATQSVLVAKYVAGKVPRLEKDLMAAAYECGYGRVIAGFHYPSDFEIGNLLGEKMYVFMNKADYADETENE